MDDGERATRLRLRLLAAARRWQAARLDFEAAVVDATVAFEGFTETYRRAEEAEFLELVVRFDED